jgi:hypothetical protein
MGRRDTELASGMGSLLKPDANLQALEIVRLHSARGFALHYVYPILALMKFCR